MAQPLHLNDSVKDLSTQILRFAEDREWLQFHSPKNLSMSIAIESAELMEVFQWSSEEPDREPDPAIRAKAAEELADVLIYCLQLANVLGIDPEHAIRTKLLINAEKYPIDLARGSSSKYTEFEK